MKHEKYTSKCEGSIIKGIKLSRSNLSNIRTLPAEVGSSSSDAMKEEKRWSGDRERVGVDGGGEKEREKKRNWT